MTRRSRRNAETTQALAVFAAGLEGRVQVQLDALSHMQATITELLVATRAEAERRESDLVRTLELVAGVCRQAVEVVEADRGEREAFLSLLSELVPQIQSRASAGLTRGSRVLGGSVVVPTADIDLVEVESDERLVSKRTREELADT